MVLQQADSELATPMYLLTTTTEYLGGFQHRVTNPRGYVTQYDFQGFDTPSKDHIKVI